MKFVDAQPNDISDIEYSFKVHMRHDTTNWPEHFFASKLLITKFKGEYRELRESHFYENLEEACQIALERYEQKLKEPPEYNF